jgi:hypothetical protein
MKTTVNQFFLSLTKINKTHLQFAMMLVTLVMLVLGPHSPVVSNSEPGTVGG